MKDAMDVLREMIKDMITPLLPDQLLDKADKVAEAVMLCGFLKGGIVVGEVRLETSISAYSPPEDDDETL